jgi:hypothetical protein
MKQRSKKYRAFRRLFIFLVIAALLLLAWQLAHRPPAPSRVAWPPPAKP